MNTLLSLALLAGLAALDRKGVAQLFLSRPIVLATAMGAIAGDPVGGAAMGAVLELLFLGAVNLGAALPPNEVMATAVCATAALALARANPPLTPVVASAALLLALPAGALGRWIDGALEQANERTAARALAAARRGDLERAARANLRGLLWPFAATFAATLAAGEALAPALAALLRLAAPVLPGLRAAYLVLIALAVAAALHAQQQRNAPAWMLGGAAAGLLFFAVFT